MRARLTTRHVRVSLAALLLLTAHGAAAPARYETLGGGNAIIVPEASPLVFRGFDSEGVASFDGRVTLSGTYYYGDNPDGVDASVVPTVEFRPDEASVRLLPYFAQREGQDEIELTNTDAFARAVVPAREWQRILKKGEPAVRGRATVVIAHYTAAIECDGTAYRAQFVSVVHPKNLRAGDMPSLGC
jgi:hypothetical protein